MCHDKFTAKYWFVAFLLNFCELPFFAWRYVRMVITRGCPGKGGKPGERKEMEGKKTIKKKNKKQVFVALRGLLF